MSCNRDHSNAATLEAGIPPEQARAIGADKNFREKLQATYGTAGDTVSAPIAPVSRTGAAAHPSLEAAAVLARQSAIRHCPKCGQFVAAEGGHACPVAQATRAHDYVDTRAQHALGAGSNHALGAGSDAQTPFAKGGPPRGWGHVGQGLSDTHKGGQSWGDYLAQGLSTGAFEAVEEKDGVLRFREKWKEHILAEGRVLSYARLEDSEALVKRLQTPAGRAEALADAREAWQTKTAAALARGDEVANAVVEDYLALGGELKPEAWERYPALAMKHETGLAADYWARQRALAEAERSEYVRLDGDQFYRATAEPGKFEIVKGSALELAGLKRSGMEFFAFKDGSRWNVNEAVTGRLIASGKTRAEAIAQAEARIQAGAKAASQTRADFLRAHQALGVVESGHASPRYTRQLPTQGVTRCGKCGQFLGRAAHTCNPAQAKAWRATQRPHRDDARTARKLLQAEVKRLPAPVPGEARVSQNPKAADRQARALAALHAADHALTGGDARAALGQARGVGVRRCPLCGEFRGETHTCESQTKTAYEAAHPYADAYPPSFETPADFGRWLQTDSEKTFGAPGNWHALDEVRSFDQKYMAVFCDTPQDAARVRGQLAYIMGGPLKVAGFKALPTPSERGETAAGADERARLFYFECDWEKSGRTNFFAEASRILEKQLREGTDVHLTDRAGPGTAGTRAYEGLGPGVRVAFASKRETDDAATLAAVQPFEAALAEAGIPLRQAYAVALGELHRFIPRCSCGRFMSPVNPVCHNPVHDRRQDGLFAVVQESKRMGWPPGGYSFKGKRQLVGAVRPSAVVEYVAPEPPQTFLDTPAAAGEQSVTESVASEPDVQLDSGQAAPPTTETTPAETPFDTPPLELTAEVLERLIDLADDKEPWKDDPPWRYLTETVVYFSALRDRLGQELARQGLALADALSLAAEALHKNVRWATQITEIMDHPGQTHDVRDTPYLLRSDFPDVADLAAELRAWLNPESETAIRAAVPALAEVGIPVNQALAVASPAAEPEATPQAALPLAESLHDGQTFDVRGQRYQLLAVNTDGSALAVRLNPDGTQPDATALTQVLSWQTPESFKAATGLTLAQRCSQCGQYADEAHQCPVVPRAESLSTEEPVAGPLGNGQPEAIAAALEIPAPPLADTPVSPAEQKAAQSPDPFALVTGERVKVRRNPKGGLDITLAGAPDAFLKDRLTGYGFRHSKKTALWHAKEDQHALAFAQQLDYYNHLAAATWPALPEAEGVAQLEKREASDDHYIARPGLGGVVLYDRLAQAEAVKLAGHEDLDVFIGEVDGEWTVTEARTGFQFAKAGTRAKALAYAENALKTKRERLDAAVREQIAQGRVTPRYGVKHCPACGQFMGEQHTCRPEAKVGFQAVQPATLSVVVVKGLLQRASQLESVMSPENFWMDGEREDTPAARAELRRLQADQGEVLEQLRAEAVKLSPEERQAFEQGLTEAQRFDAEIYGVVAQISEVVQVDKSAPIAPAQPAPIVVQLEIATPAGKQVAFGVQVGEVVYQTDGSQAGTGNWRPVTNADREAYKVYETKKGKWGDRARLLKELDAEKVLALATEREEAAQQTAIKAQPGAAHCVLCGNFVSPEGQGHKPTCGQVGQAVAATPAEQIKHARAEVEIYAPTADSRIERIPLSALYAKAEADAGEVADIGGRGNAKQCQQIAETMWSQIDANAKMSMAARHPTPIVPPKMGKRNDYGPEFMPGLEFAVNCAEDAGGGFVKIPEHYNPRKPKHVMRVLLDEGADTYVVQRVKKGRKGQPDLVEWEASDVYADELGSALFRVTGGNAPYEKYEQALQDCYGKSLADVGLVPKSLDGSEPVDEFCDRMARERNLTAQSSVTPAQTETPAKLVEAAVKVSELGDRIDDLNHEMDELEIARAGADPETDAELGKQINALDINADALRKEQQAQNDTLDAAERKAQFYLCANCGHEFWPRYQAEGEPARCPDCSATQNGTNRLAVAWPNGRTYSVPLVTGDGATSPDAFFAEAQTMVTKTGGAIYTLAEGEAGARQLVKGERAGAGYVVLPQGGPETIDLPINNGSAGGASGDEDPMIAMLKTMQEQLAQANATLAQLKAEGDALSAELSGKD